MSECYHQSVVSLKKHPDAKFLWWWCVTPEYVPIDASVICREVCSTQAVWWRWWCRAPLSH